MDWEEALRALRAMARMETTDDMISAFVLILILAGIILLILLGIDLVSTP